VLADVSWYVIETNDARLTEVDTCDCQKHIASPQSASTELRILFCIQERSAVSVHDQIPHI